MKSFVKPCVWPWVHFQTLLAAQSLYKITMCCRESWYLWIWLSQMCLHYFSFFYHVPTPFRLNSDFLPLYWWLNFMCECCLACNINFVECRKCVFRKGIDQVYVWPWTFTKATCWKLPLLAVQFGNSEAIVVTLTSLWNTIDQ